MRRYVSAVVLLAVAVLPLGCSGDGVAYSAQEYRSIGRRVEDMDRRQLIDDWHYFMLDEQPSRMSRWAVE
ncbi:MAG: hypothetical protein HRF43_00255 [Phycisphaerae bacterium]|jgi:hypothetical protein